MGIGKMTQEKTQKAFDNLLDTFSGADGGIRFVRFSGFLQELDLRASNGDQAAKELVNMVHCMSRLIDIAQMEE